jgi:hypothetical protein
MRGAPVAVASGVAASGTHTLRAAGVLHAPIVIACSRAAWAMGVRLGMTATAARGLSTVADALHIVTADPRVERDTVRAVADSLLALTPVIDLGGRVGGGGAHLAMYAEVPAKVRGASFGERLLEVLDELGVAARIGIADDRFTAWVAAAHSGSDERGVVAVPRGGSAAFLARRPLSLLAIPPEVQHMLEALGVRTLGEFAALPAPSIARPLEADYQALARGESGAQLRPYMPDAPIREEVVVSAGNVLELDGSLGGPAALALVARRIARRLAGRGRAAARLEVGGAVRDGEPVDFSIMLEHPVASADELARSLGPVLEASNDVHGSWRLHVLVAAEAVVAGVEHVFAEGSSPFERVSSDDIRPMTTQSRASAQSALHRQSVRYVPRGVGEREPHETHGGPRGESCADSLGGADDGMEPHADQHIDATLSPLAVVLSSSGSLFALTAPGARSERPDTHRRTRRGKQRRARPTSSLQPRLFDRGWSK